MRITRIENPYTPPFFSSGRKTKIGWCANTSRSHNKKEPIMARNNINKIVNLPVKQKRGKEHANWNAICYLPRHRGPAMLPVCQPAF